MMALAMDRKTGLVLHQELYESTDAVENAQKGFIQFIEKSGFRPREVWMTQKTNSSLNPLIKQFRVNVMEVERLKHIEQLKVYLNQMNGNKL